MKWLLLIIVFSKCPATSSIEFSTLAACQSNQTKLEQEWTAKSIDAVASCLRVE